MQKRGGHIPATALLIFLVPKLARDLRPALEEGAGHATGVVAAGEPDGGVGSVGQRPWPVLLELLPSAR